MLVAGLDSGVAAATVYAWWFCLRARSSPFLDPPRAKEGAGGRRQFLDGDARRCYREGRGGGLCLQSSSRDHFSLRPAVPFLSARLLVKGCATPLLRSGDDAALQRPPAAPRWHSMGGSCRRRRAGNRWNSSASSQGSPSTGPSSGQRSSFVGSLVPSRHTERSDQIVPEHSMWRKQPAWLGSSNKQGSPGSSRGSLVRGIGALGPKERRGVALAGAAVERAGRIHREGAR